MKLQQLRFLVETAEHGSMSAAARAAYVTQPALTRSIRALERELGLTLFERSGRAVVLTEVGQEVVALARDVLDRVATIEELAGAVRARAPALVIATTPTLETEIGGLLAELAAHRPHCRVSVLRRSGREQIRAALLAGEAEIGISDLPVGPELVETELEEREVVLIVPPGSPLPHPLPVGRLGEVPLIVTSSASPRRREVDAMFERLGLELQVAHETDERSSWIPAVRMGIGSCLWYRGQAEQALLAGTELRSLDPPFRRVVGIVHRDERISELAAELVEIGRRRGSL